MLLHVGCVNITILLRVMLGLEADFSEIALMKDGSYFVELTKTLNRGAAMTVFYID